MIYDENAFEVEKSRTAYNSAEDIHIFIAMLEVDELNEEGKG